MDSHRLPDTTPNRLEEAFALHLPALRALPADKVAKPKLDIAAAGAPLLGYLPRYLALVAELAALPCTNTKLIEELPRRAMAMVQAYANWLRSTSPTVPLPQLLERGGQVRKIMLDSAPGLLVLDLLDAQAIADIQRGNGYQDTAMDLLALAGLYRDWASLSRANSRRVRARDPRSSPRRARHVQLLPRGSRSRRRGGNACGRGSPGGSVTAAKL